MLHSSITWYPFTEIYLQINGIWSSLYLFIEQSVTIYTALVICLRAFNLTSRCYPKKHTEINYLKPLNILNLLPWGHS